MSQPYRGPESRPTDPRRNYIACLNCRQRKTKCVINQDSPDDPCRRCVEKGLQCVYQAVEHVPAYTGGTPLPNYPQQNRGYPATGVAPGQPHGQLYPQQAHNPYGGQTQTPIQYGGYPSQGSGGYPQTQSQNQPAYAVQAGYYGAGYGGGATDLVSPDVRLEDASGLASIELWRSIEAAAEVQGAESEQVEDSVPRPMIIQDEALVENLEALLNTVDSQP
ncbi:Zn(2)-C6 fungal-type domain-containing protein [Mycena kentingensis (nom. inval.)]|nr:Zn(2)-C6 fungal-type domain-containing protein [Mycena kentingensis (nom. inval.)]